VFEIKNTASDTFWRVLSWCSVHRCSVPCFERRCPKQNSVACCKSKYLAPWAGYTTGLFK